MPPTSSRVPAGIEARTVSSAAAIRWFTSDGSAPDSGSACTVMVGRRPRRHKYSSSSSYPESRELAERHRSTRRRRDLEIGPGRSVKISRRTLQRRSPRDDWPYRTWSWRPIGIWLQVTRGSLERRTSPELSRQTLDAVLRALAPLDMIAAAGSASGPGPFLERRLWHTCDPFESGALTSSPELRRFGVRR